MKLYFPRNGPRPTKYQQGARSRPPTMPTVPEDVLIRHGARVLNPAEAVRPPGGAPPHPTVYRYGTLLIPEDVQRSGGLRALTHVLREVGLTLVPPPPLAEMVGPEAANSRALATLPRAVGLSVPHGKPPAAIDAWTALQTLTAAADRGAVDRDLVGRISLEHLLVGANTATHGSPDTRELFGGTRTGLSGRLPLDVILPAPVRRTLADLPVGRRPVVAVLDTGIGDHPWLRYADRAAAPGSDEFVIVDGQLQKEIYHNGVETQKASNTPSQPIDGFLDLPSIPEPLVGELGSHTGHGTFIAGIIRQLAPDAQVRSIRVMHPDGFAHESDVLLALGWIAAEVERAQHGDPNAAVVDIVSLSLGYFDETPELHLVTKKMTAAINDLTQLGVTVVAAAGNFSTSREFFPAAVAGLPAKSGDAPMVSVGALNPNGTIAHFSDEGPWVRCYASGVAMVSAFPTTYAGAVNPDETVIGAGRRRETFDPDDFSSGFALWSGTSFSAPLVAAHLAAALVTGAETDPANLALTDPSQAATVNRAWQALASVQKEWP